MSAQGTPPGWYPDPAGSGGMRWWDGSTWAEQVTPSAPPAPYGAPPVVGGVDSFSIVALVTALVGIPIVPIVFGFLARGRIKRSGGVKTGNGMAIAGIVIGIIGLLFLIVYIVLIATGEIDLDSSSSSGF